MVGCAVGVKYVRFVLIRPVSFRPQTSPWLAREILYDIFGTTADNQPS